MVEICREHPDHIFKRIFTENTLFQHTNKLIIQCKSSKTSQRSQKPRQGEQLIHRRYTKSSSQ